MKSACNMYQGDKKCIHNCSQKKHLKWRDHVGDLGINGKDNIKIDLKEIWCEGVNWIQLVQEKV
jgi:hypothetical protein